MKLYILVFLLAPPLSLSAQLLSNDFDLLTNEDADTIYLMEINPNIKIKYYNEFLIYFNKDDVITEIGSLRNKNSLDEEFEKRIKKAEIFLNEIDEMLINDYYIFQPGQFDLNNKEDLTKYLLLELACPLLEKGKLKIEDNGYNQKKIFKLIGYYPGERYGPSYWSENWKPIWICPPIRKR